MENRIGVGFGVMLTKDGKILLGKRHSKNEEAASSLNNWIIPSEIAKLNPAIISVNEKEVMQEAEIKLHDSSVFNLNGDKIEVFHFVNLGIISNNQFQKPQLNIPSQLTELKNPDVNKLIPSDYFPMNKYLKDSLEKI